MTNNYITDTSFVILNSEGNVMAIFSSKEEAVKEAGKYSINNSEVYYIAKVIGYTTTKPREAEYVENTPMHVGSGFSHV